MRCLALAQELKENGPDVKFICRKNKGILIDKICSSGFHTYELELSDENKTNNKPAHSSWLGATQQKDIKAGAATNYNLIGEKGFLMNLIFGYLQ